MNRFAAHGKDTLNVYYQLSYFPGASNKIWYIFRSMQEFVILQYPKSYELGKRLFSKI